MMTVNVIAMNCKTKSSFCVALVFKGGLVPIATIINEKHRTPPLIYYEKQKALFSFSFLKHLVRRL